MNKWKVLWIAGAAGLMISGCKGFATESSQFQPETSSIYVDRSGGIFSATVEPYENGNYNSETLKEFIANEVASYNESLGAPAASENTKETILPVAVNSCLAENGRLTVIYQYENSEAFRAFANEYKDTANQTVSFGTGTAQAGREAGWFLDGGFVKLGKGETITEAQKKDLEKLGKERMVMVEASHPVTIQTEGTLLYMTRNVTLLEKNLVQVPEGRHYLIFR
ncbi:MAG: hypothetical protein HFG49_05560 [Lachnospiraceae bacterium]|nr:hypothetical protein [Lachnospiraceae bacterium]